MNFRTLIEQLREFFLMPTAIADAQRHAAEKGQEGVAHARTARSLLAAAEALGDAPERRAAVAVLLRYSALMAIQGLARREHVNADEPELVDAWNAAKDLPGIASTLEALSQAARERVAHCIVEGFGTAPDAWTPSELPPLNGSLSTIAHRSVERLEGDIFAPPRLRSLQLLRVAGALLAAMAIVGLLGSKIRRSLAEARALKADQGQVNVALHKPVTVSSDWSPGAYPPERLVDGNSAELGCHTETQQNPWALIDLGRVHAIHRVVVTNRLDGNLERALPLRIEVSSDGSTFTQYARHDSVFKVLTATSVPTNARYVRVSVAGTSILHLNEVEVY